MIIYCKDDRCVLRMHHPDADGNVNHLYPPPFAIVDIVAKDMAGSIVATFVASMEPGVAWSFRMPSDPTVRVEEISMMIRKEEEE